MKYKLLRFSLLLFILLTGGTNAIKATTYEPVTSANQLVAGKKYLFVGKYKTNSMTSPRWATVKDYNSSKYYYNSIDVETTEADNSLGIEVTEPATVVTFTLGGESDAWTFLGSDGKYMNLTSTSNQVHQADAVTTNNQRWTVAIDGTTSVATIKNNQFTARKLWANINSSRFACYGDPVTSNTFYLFVEKESSEPEPEPEITDGYYVVGSMTSWAVDANYKMALNEEAGTEEYSFNMDLTTSDQFKVVKVDGSTQTWYPDGMGNNYGENGEITADGNYTIYFRPNYDGGDDWFYNCIFVASNDEPIAEATWTLAGSAKSLFGESWWFEEEGSSVNNLEKGDGHVWTKTYTNKLLTGIVYYGVFKNHGTDEYYPAGLNPDDLEGTAQQLTVDGIGYYDVTFTFNDETHALSAQATKKSDYTITSVVVNGNSSELFNGDLVLAETSAGVWTGTIEAKQLSAGTIQFGATINNENVLTPYGSLTITEAGKYDVAFTYTVATNKITAEATLWVEQPETYAIVGELTGGWNDAGTEPDAAVMTLQDNGLYTYVVESFAAQAKTYQYKLRANNKWGVFELPASGNQEYTFNEAGNYKLTFTANVTGEAIDEVAAYTLTLKAEKIEEPQPVLHTYTIAGDAAIANGKQWDVAAEENLMVQDEQDATKYTLKIEGAKIAAGTYSYKVVVDNSWDNQSIPKGANAQLTVDADGIYTIDYTLTLGEVDGELGTVTAVATQTGDWVVTKKYRVSGTEALTGVNWGDAEDVNLMTENGEGLYTITFENKELEASSATNTYEYKIVVFTYENDVLTGKSWRPNDNQVVNIPEAGKYNVTITFNPATEECTSTAVKVDEPQPELNTYTATFDNGGNWEEVYAYAWTDGEPAVEFLGTWPGTKLEKDGDVYAVTIKAEAAPEKIIFNNGKDGDEKVQTADLAFEDGKAYTYTAPVEPQPEYTSTATYAIQVDETHTAGETVGVKDADEDVVATLTFGFEGGAEFKAGKANDALAEEGFVAFTEGNGENGSATAGTTYIITPKYDGEITVGVVLNANKAFYILENDEAMEGFNGIKVDEKYYGTYTFNVQADAQYKVFCTGSKLGFYGFNYSFNKPEPVEPDAEITSVQLQGDWNWQSGKEALTLEAGEANTYTGVLDLTDITGDQEFKLVVNGGGDESDGWKGWIGTNNLTVDAPENWVVATAETTNANCTLNNATTGYQTYTITATWTPSPDYAAGWTLKIEGKDVRPEVVLNDYTATFTTDVWDEVYAYVWSGEGENKLLGDWPGTKLEKNAETGLYDVAFQAEAAPEFIIFNNGNGGVGNQTADLEFVDGKAYSYEPVTGDANLDGEVTTGDAVAAVSYALGTVEPTVAQFKAADVNKNEVITVSDAVGIVNIALGEPEPTPGAKAFGYEANNYLTLKGQQVGLTNATEFVAFQMDVTLTDGAQFNGVQLSQRAAGLQVVTNKVGENTWRIIAFSMDNSVITGSTGSLLTIDTNGEMTFSNIEFADADAQAYELTFDYTTGIDSIHNSQFTIDSDAPMYNTAGQRVGRNYKGVVIQNGKKYVIK